MRDMTEREQSPTYTVRFPFTLHEEHTIKTIDPALIFHTSGIKISLGEEHGYYVIKASPFPSEEEALKAVGRIWGSLAWLTLNHQIPFEATFSRVASDYRPTFGEGTEEIGAASAFSMPQIYQSGLKLGLVGLVPRGSLSIKLIHPPQKIVDGILEGLNLPGSHVLLDNSRLQLALELYNLWFFETSPRARLLTSVTSLEALAENYQRSRFVQDVIREVREYVDNKIEGDKVSHEDQDSLKDIRNTLGYKQEISIRLKVRRLIRQTLEKDKGQTREIDGMLDDFDWVWKLRGDLVHGDNVPPEPLDKAVEKARRIAREILLAKMQQDY